MTTTRRLFFSLVLLFIATPALAAGDHPSVAFMQKVGKDMLAAHRAGTVGRFASVIQNYADVPAIANYSLGQFKPNLKAGQRADYYRGVVTFMSRYFADQSREFEVAKYTIGEARVGDDKSVVVGSRVFLMNGQTYNVEWSLRWVGGRYKVNDVKVLGFSLTYMQRGLFTSFISKRKGDVSQLVAALIR